MRVPALSFLCVLSFATACSGDVCSRFESFDPHTRYDGCSGTAPSTVQVTQSQCEQDLTSCTANDDTVLNNYVNCLNALPTCQPGQEESWNSDYSACQAMTSSLSTQCAVAFVF